MSPFEFRQPKVIVPYPGPCENSGCNDMFVYLRPETNGVEVESILLRVIHSNPVYKQELKLCYLANIPGDFIIHRRIIEKYYILQIYFAKQGKKAFTPPMKEKFEEFFDTSFDKATVMGAFEAIDYFGMDYDQLFRLRVSDDEMLLVNGQNIKHYQGVYIINYDIPAILHKNNNNTDIAVMIFRTTYDYSSFHGVIDEIGKALVEEGKLPPGRPLSRVFHYSKGPFDQIRDAIGYLYSQEGRHISLKQINFAHYLLEKGVKMNQVMGTIKHPLLLFQMPDGIIVEKDIFTYTRNDSYSQAYKKYMQIVAHRLLQ